MTPVKFPYVVDLGSRIISSATRANKLLDSIGCPVLQAAVKKLRDTLANEPNHNLMVAAQNLVLEDVMATRDTAILTLAVVTSELARRYMLNELDPVYHAGDMASFDAAMAAYKRAREDASSETVVGG